MQYIDPSARQTLHDLDTATLVRSQDRFNHCTPDVFADGVMGPEAIATHERLEKLRKVTWASA